MGGMSFVTFPLLFWVLSIPDGGRAQPDQSQEWTGLRRELRRTLVAQPAVRPALIVGISSYLERRKRGVDLVASYEGRGVKG